MKLQIRRAELGDVREMERLEAKCFRMKFDRNFVWFWKPLVDHAYVYKAVADGRIVGGTIAFPTRRKGEVYVESVFVHPEFRSMGIATRLLKKVGRDSSCKRIVLDTYPKWRAAVSLYEKMGFKVTKRLRNYYEDGTDRVMMVERL